MRTEISATGRNYSITEIANTISGTKAAGIALRTNAYERKNGSGTGTALRSQYGFGDKMARRQADDILHGRAELIKDGTSVTVEGRAKTIFDGKRKIYVNGSNSDGTVESALAMGITLQHEAYRDGITESGAAQKTETVQSVYKHTEMARRMAGDSMTGRMMSGVLSRMPELKSDVGNYNRYIIAMARAGGDEAKRREAYEQYAAYVDGTYDSSGDYWKLISRADGTHSFEADYDKAGNLIKEVTIEYQDADGKVLGTAKPDGKELQRGLGQAASLVNALGKERAMQMLGIKDINVLSQYDNKTLKDVLKLDDRSLMLLRRSGGVNLESFNVSEKEILSLLGEKLLKKAGGKWDGKNWVGLEKLSEYASLTDRKVLEGGIAAKVNENGSFTYGTVEERIGRDTRSYYIYNAEKNEKRLEYGGLDSRTIISRDLQGNIIDEQTKTFDGWTTVQSMLPGKDNEGKIPYTTEAFIPMNVRDLYDGKRTIKVGPETIAEGAVAYKILKMAEPRFGLKAGDIYLQAVMGNLLVKGYRIGADGNAGYAEGRHLLHPTKKYGNMGCGVTGSVDAFHAYTDFLTKTLGLPAETVIFGKIYQKDNPYEWVYR